MIGIGAGGRQVTIQLAALGARRIQWIDHDCVEPVNITTQRFFLEDLGKLKVHATAEHLRRIDPDIQIATIADRDRPTITTGDAICCCVDTIGIRDRR